MTTDEGIVFKGDRVIIPVSMRTEIMEQLHSGHIGIQGTLRRARDLIYWPGISNDIK